MRMIMFPGQGSQSPGMAKAWFGQFKEFDDAFVEASEFCGLDLKTLCTEGTSEELSRTDITQPAMLVMSVAIFRVLREHFGFETDLFVGHSLGEYSALVAAGVMPLGAASLLVHYRGRYMQEAVPLGVGGMTALLFRGVDDAWDRVLSLCEELAANGHDIFPANNNSDEQVVVAGTLAGLSALEGRVNEIGCRRAIRLPVSAPFHSPLVKSAAERLLPELKKVPLSPQPQAKLISNVDAELYSLENVEAVPERLYAQVYRPVLWRQTVAKALQLGYQFGVECGPGSVLAGLCKKIVVGGKLLAVSSVSTPEELQAWDARQSESQLS